MISTKSLKNAFSILFQAEIQKNAVVGDDSDVKFNINELMQLNVDNSRLLIDDDARQLIIAVLENVNELDVSIQNALHNWKLSNLATSDRTILRIGAYLILYTDSDVATTIKSMRKLAETFSDQKAPSFVTGVLSNLQK
ncbi:MAG: hypothetical protein LBL41_05290 [Bifidobacteriaceae bacterium]|nr:hypothetical protein [Bifidobacteriaceae bacterium]